MGLFFRPRRPLARLAADAAGADVVYRADRVHIEQDRVSDEATSADQATRQAVSRSLSYPSAAGDVTTTGLERLVQLHNDGDLTEVEFSAAKARLLGV